MSPYIPQRIKRAKQQITVKLYQDRLAMLDQYGRFIEDSRDYIIDQALDLVFKKDKHFLQWLEQQSAIEQGEDQAANNGKGGERFHPSAGTKRENQRPDRLLP
jgi:predicted transcriptional regulator